MKLPNGYGSVVKLKGVRRNPYAARKTAGWNDKGHPVYLFIGYYPTREAALIALAQYNNEPWNIEKEKITFEELFKMWTQKKAPKLGKSNRQNLKGAYGHCSKLFKMKYKDIRSYHMQDAIDNCGFGYSTQTAIKNLFGHLDNLAFELDIINKRYSELTTSASIPETKKLPFTEDEIKALWNIKDAPWVDSVLVFLYTGLRISELLDIRRENVDTEQGTIKGGTKTDAGKDRLIPIHSLIAEIVRKRLSDGGAYLFTHNGKKVSVWQYYIFWRVVMKMINANHTVHETRHTFRSRLDSAGANKRCIDLIMGHKSKDVGERVYTHKTIQELKTEIELVTR